MRPRPLFQPGEQEDKDNPSFSETAVVHVSATTFTYRVVPLGVSPSWLVQVLLAAVAEALDGLGDAAEGAVDLIRVHVLGVVLHHAGRRTEIQTVTG